MSKMPITATMIKELRERTGVGMGKCKEALEEANGDMEFAISNLRKAGIASAVKKEGRTTNEGMIGFFENDKTAAIVEVNSETDFVAKNERFKEFLENIAAEIAKTHPASLEEFLAQPYSKDTSISIDQYRATVVQTIGENIQIKRLFTTAKSPSKSIGIYSHLGGKVVTMVEIEGSDAEQSLAKDIAMHVAAAHPEFLSPEKVPAELINNEKEIAKSQIKNKPENFIDKIVEGKLNAYYESVCLTKQKFIRDDSKSIAQIVEDRAKQNGKPLQLTNFLRWTVGQ
ncbi:Elongation factor Ts [Neochlamydia sp. AcF65]|uniref:translation elongation factor Ts n=1 Tax=Neochlamydia sp. AcF65 TaxID=2795735 RepID=UPI001BD870C7|nr:translation elongation factor Ts [Neochlamydia sp. AcF65]MBS4165713.1 Elongation factor Ts [Neochlamydia sp. AcF65]